MPIKDGSLYCINHPESPMVRNGEFNVITQLKKNEQNIEFLPNSGVPVVLYYCSHCGYVEMYAAQKTPFWEQNEKK